MKKTSLIIFSSSFLFPQAFADDRDKDMEIIEVKAQKRPQNINDVAISITILDGKSLSDQNIKDTTALSGQVANFKITQNAAEGTPPAINIRGVGSMDYNTSTTSPVGVYVDNVAGGSANSQLVNLYDIESIEILKGPQGTLFGRNTTGGAVLINTKRPESDFSGYMSLGLAQRDHIKFEGAVNLPISENVYTRLAVNHQEYDYSITNLYEGAPEAKMQQTHGRLSVLANFDKLEVFGKIHVEKWDGAVQPVGNIGVYKQLGPTPTLCTPSEAGSSQCTDSFGFNDGSNDFYDVSVNNDINNNSPHKTDSWGADVNLNYQLTDNSYVVSISSFNTLDRIHFFNSDGSPASLAEGGQNVYTDVYSQELRYHLELDKAYIIAGGFYLDESLTQDNFLDLFRGWRAVETLFSNAATFFYDNEINTQVSAVFAHIDYDFNDQTTLSTGLRYTEEKIDYRAVGTINVPLSLDDQMGFTVPGWNELGKVKDDNISGKISINHKFNSNLTAFMSYSRGYKSGGYNGAIITSQEEAQRNDYGAETLDAIELGSRIHWDEDNAYLYLAAFNYDYQDQQVFMNQAAISPNAPPIQLLDNVGESNLYGAEAELKWQLTSQFNIQLGIGYLPEANLEQFVNAKGETIRDNRLPFTSKWNVNGFIDYVLPVNEGEVIFQLNFDHQSDFYFDQNQNPYASQDDYTLFNARIAYEMDDWSVAAWGKNITNEEYSNLKFDLVGLLGMLQDFKGESRQLGVDISYSF
ncbi:TonB-dependent receptor [Pseudoalteromonas sp. C2R02]|uniref:TonB-dependent receptor n=1 Tax=Pseudoalteromonas sp. C2R02 TaxID=2841565 RepID=UPI001C094D6D|nr:TonB-dependent receptor [Pseudoalteromonas sp. C2R02]